MTIDHLIQKGELTKDGISLASKLMFYNCDHECRLCERRNKNTNGPGGVGCPAEGKIDTVADMDELFKIFGDTHVPPA